MDDTTSGGNPASPASFAEAFAADASPAPDSTASQTTTPAAEAAPPSQETTTPAADDPRSPFIPRPRFDEVNGKYNELKAWKEQYAWAEQVDRNAVHEAMRIAQTYTQDNPAFIRQILAEALADQQLAPAIRSELGRYLAQRQAAGPDLNPIPLALENGQTLPIYTAEQIAALKQQWQDEIKREFEPIRTTVEQQRQAYEQAERLRQAEEFGRSTFADVQTWPGMDNPENRQKVAAELKAMRLESDDPREVQLALNTAYRKVVLPSLNQRAESQLLDTLKRNAAASTSPNPGSAVPTAPKRIDSFHDKSLQWS